MIAEMRLTIKDVAVLCISAVLLLGNLTAFGTAGRERAKRAVCLANLKQLTRAWIAYADQNDDKIVNGVGGFHYYASGGYTGNGQAAGIVERAWVGRGWGNNWNNQNVADTGLTEQQQKQNIREGALWPLVGDEHGYKCPVARPHEFVTYSIVDAMNGMYRSGTVGIGGPHPYAVGVKVGRTVLWIKNRNEILVPPPAERMVFIDEGAMTPDSFGVYYGWGPWWDDPPVRHNNGATVSWADGHASYLKWQGAETIERGRRCQDYYGGGGFMPQTEEGIKDLEDLRRAVWGRLGYEPSER